jgi:hypothetical protein
MTDKNYGRDDLMALSSVRYCLGRASYIVSDCCEWLIEQWPNICPNTQANILRDIREAIDGDRAGMDMDKRLWCTTLDKLLMIKDSQ